MHTRSVIAGAGGAVALAAAAVFAINAEAATPTPEPRPAVVAGEVVCPGQEVVGRPVDLTAWTEIRDLRDLGFPVCDVLWGFYALDGEATGWSFINTDTGRTEVWIDAVDAAWADEPDPALAIRSTVRHEYAHALVYAAGWYGAEDGEALRGTFTDTLNRDAKSEGHEAAAEAVAAILADLRGDDRRAYYVDTVSAESLAAASGFIE